MLARRLVAGPSRALLIRHMASAAVAAEGAEFLGTSTTAPAASTSSAHAAAAAAAATTSRVASRRPPYQHNPTYKEPKPPGRSKHVADLLKLLHQPHSTNLDTNKHDEIWEMYRQLTPLERKSLLPKELSRILRTVVPRYQHYWKYLHRTPKRLHMTLLSVKVATEWEGRLRLVLGDLTATNEVYNVDWWFALRTLSNMGLVTACEAIVAQLPDAVRHHSVTSEYRLGAVVRWARNVLDTGRVPKVEEAELVHNTFWEIFRHMDSTKINPFTLRLLLSATAEVSSLVKFANHEESTERMTHFVNVVVKQGYGIDLDNLAMSVQQLSQTDTGLPRLSAKALTAILRHLVLREIDPYRLISAFEILSVTESASIVNRYSSRVEEDEDDDFGPPVSAPPAPGKDTEADPDRRNWMGFKVRKTAGAAEASPSAFFDGSSPSTSTESPSPSGETATHRFRLDFLPSLPSPDTIPTPATRAPLPLTPNYNDEGIVVLLNYLRARRAPVLFKHVLESALHDAQASQAAWLPAYLSCAPADRAQLYAPLRIAPEWFRIALAFSRENYNKWSAPFARAVTDAAAWTQSFAAVIVDTEAARGVPVTLGSRGRPALPTPAFAEKPRQFRLLRNAHVFVVSDGVEALYADIDQMEHLVGRAREMEARRLKWRFK